MWVVYFTNLLYHFWQKDWKINIVHSKYSIYKEYSIKTQNIFSAALDYCLVNKIGFLTLKSIFLFSNL